MDGIGVVAVVTEVGGVDGTGGRHGDVGGRHRERPEAAAAHGDGCACDGRAGGCQVASFYLHGDRFTLGGIEGVSIRQARFVGIHGDAADVVDGGSTRVGNDDVVGGGDGVTLLAVATDVIIPCRWIVGSVVQQVSEIAVVGIDIVAGKGGTMGGADGNLFRVKERIVDIGSSFTPAYEASATGGFWAEQLAVEDATADGEFGTAVGHSYQSAVGAVVAGGVDDAATDGHAAAAVLDGHRAIHLGDDACTKFGFGVDVAGGVEVVDGGAVDVAERCGILCGKAVGGSAVADGERVPLPVEGAAEPVAACTHHRRDVDVGGEIDSLSAVGCSVVDIRRERVPVARRADGQVLRPCRCACHHEDERHRRPHEVVSEDGYVFHCEMIVICLWSVSLGTKVRKIDYVFVWFWQNFVARVLWRRSRCKDTTDFPWLPTKLKRRSDLHRSVLDVFTTE